MRCFSIGRLRQQVSPAEQKTHDAISYKGIMSTPDQLTLVD